MKVFSVNNVYTILDDKVLAKEKCVTVLGKRFFFEAKLSPKEADNISAAIKKGKKVKTKPFLPNRKVILPKFQPQYGGKSLVFIRTHYLNENLVKEYLKIEKAGLDCVFLLDNTNNVLPNNGDDVQSVELYGHKVKYIPFYLKENVFRFVRFLLLRNCIITAINAKGFVHIEFSWSRCY